MAYRGPRFCYRHSAKEAADDGNTFNENRDNAVWPVSRIYDNQLDRPWQGETGTGNFISWDRGSSPGYFPDRLVIPAGNNLPVGAQVDVRQANSPITTAGAGALVDSAVVAVEGNQIDQELSSDVTNRYVSVHIPTNLGTAPFLSEVYLTEIETPVRGPRPQWLDTPVPNVIETETRSGKIYRSVRGPELRRITWRFERIDQSGDLTFFRTLASRARDQIIFVDPPTNDDTSPDPGFFAWLNVQVFQVLDVPVVSGLGYAATVEAIEAQ